MDQEVYLGYIFNGDLIGAMAYLKQFPAQQELYERYLSIFEYEKYVEYDVPAELNGILADYQSYYRDVFYLRMEKDEAATALKRRLVMRLGCSEDDLVELEERRIVPIFQSHGFFFMGGKTSGYYGPYVWRTAEMVRYDVDLPDGVQSYTVQLLDGFLTRSWLEFLSFGQISPGGWTDGDGVICCVKSAWNLESEAFRVSLLKHEAQHARDLEADRQMSSERLEYRAKLVELICSNERNLMGRFLQEADPSDPENGHAVAAYRIVCDFTELSGTERLLELQIPQIQRIARELFCIDSKI